MSVYSSRIHEGTLKCQNGLRASGWTDKERHNNTGDEHGCEKRGGSDDFFGWYSIFSSLVVVGIPGPVQFFLSGGWYDFFK